MTDDIKRGEVKRLRLKMGFSKRAVSNGIGVTEGHYGQVELGKRESQPCLNAAYAWLIGQNHVDK